MGNTTLCDVEGVGRDWGFVMKEICDEGGLEVICGSNERSFPALPVLTSGSRGEGCVGRHTREGGVSCGWYIGRRDGGEFGDGIGVDGFLEGVGEGLVDEAE